METDGAKPKRARVAKEVKMLTQEERFKEAQLTEVINAKSLEELLRVEEAAKKVAAKGKGHLGPTILYTSAGGKGFLAFSQCEFPTWEKPEKLPSTMQRGCLCVVSKRPARYLDPQTNLPYSGIAELKAIRAKPTVYKPALSVAVVRAAASGGGVVADIASSSVRSSFVAPSIAISSSSAFPSSSLSWSPLVAVLVDGVSRISGVCISGVA